MYIITSEDGYKWHKEHALRVAEIIFVPKEHVCQECGKKYISRAIQEIKFCSRNCVSKNRRKSGIDNEKRKCLYCSKEFTISRYSKTKCCNRVCAWNYRKLQRLAIKKAPVETEAVVI